MIRRPSLVLVILTGLNLLNYLDRFVLSAVLPKVQADLHLSKLVSGWLPVVFLIGFFLTSPIFGALADSGRQGIRPRLAGVGIGLWSLATVGSGLVRSTVAFFSMRAAVGVGEASYTTIAPAILDDVAPPRSRARWMAIFSVATPVGAALGYIVGGAVEHMTGSWRTAFFVAGGPGLLLAVLCLAIADPPRASSAGVSMVPWKAARELVAVPVLLRAILGFCAYNFATGGFAYWAPTYIFERYGMEVGKASFQFGLVTVAGGFLGTITGGALCDVRIRHYEGQGRPADTAASIASLEVCALSALIGTPFAAAAILAPSPDAFFASAFACEVGLFLSGGPINLAVLKSAPLPLRVSAMALTIFAIHALGDMWSPPLIGLAWDHAPIAWAMMFIPVAYAAATLIWWNGVNKARELSPG